MYAKQLLSIPVINDLPVFGQFIKKIINEPVFVIYMPSNPNNNDDDNNDDDDNDKNKNKDNKKN